MELILLTLAGMIMHLGWTMKVTGQGYAGFKVIFILLVRASTLALALATFKWWWHG